MDRLDCEFVMIRLGLIATVLASCQHGRDRSAPSPVLLFDGTGTSRNDVAAIESLLAGGGDPLLTQ